MQQAVNWLCDHEGSPALDQPSPFLPSSSSGDGGAGLPPWAAYPPPAAGPLASGAVVAGGGRPEPSDTASFSNPLLSGQPSGGSGWGLLGASGAGMRSSGSGGGMAVQRSLASGVGVAGILKQEELKAARTDA